VKCSIFFAKGLLHFLDWHSRKLTLQKKLNDVLNIFDALLSMLLLDMILF